MILSGEDVAGGPAYFSAEGDQCFNEYTGLNGHVNTSKNFGPRQRLLGAVLIPQGYQRGHLAFGNIQLPAAPACEVDVCDFVVSKILNVYSSVHNRFLGPKAIGFKSKNGFYTALRNSSARSVSSQGKS